MKRTATAITQNPYIDLVDSDDDDEDNNQPDVRIFQAPPGYPLYLQPKDEVKARMAISLQSSTMSGKRISTTVPTKDLYQREAIVLCVVGVVPSARVVPTVAPTRGGRLTI